MEEGALQQIPVLDASSIAKTCTKCGILKGRDGFYPGQCRFNLMSTCKECTKAKNNRLRKQALPVLAPDVQEKRCSRCNQMKPASAYFKSRGRASGLRSDCKECEGAALRARKAKKKSNESQSDLKKLNAESLFKKHSEASVGLAKSKSCYEGHKLLCNLCKIRKGAGEFKPRSDEKSALLVCTSCFELTTRQIELAKMTAKKSKMCFVCKTVQSAASFVASGKTADGLGVVCRECRQDRHRATKLQKDM